MNSKKEIAAKLEEHKILNVPKKHIEITPEMWEKIKSKHST